MRRLFLILPLIATPAFAELSEVQQQAADLLQPHLQQQLESEKSAQILATCIAEVGSTREVATIANSEGTGDAFRVANDIMTRPEVITCVTDALAN